MATDRACGGWKGACPSHGAPCAGAPEAQPTINVPFQVGGQNDGGPTPVSALIHALADQAVHRLLYDKGSDAPFHFRAVSSQLHLFLAELLWAIPLLDRAAVTGVALPHGQGANTTPTNAIIYASNNLEGIVSLGSRLHQLRAALGPDVALGEGCHHEPSFGGGPRARPPRDPPCHSPSTIAYCAFDPAFCLDAEAITFASFFLAEFTSILAIDLSCGAFPLSRAVVPPLAVLAMLIRVVFAGSVLSIHV